MSTEYRPEIDGLRAIAVIAVVLYHADVRFFAEGGFLGVDVFFVISGFLITRLILRDLEREAFSLGVFIQRRALRILPALYVVVTSTFIAWSLIETPREIQALAGSTLAAILLVPNFYFAFQGGYFTTPLEEMPLLHTWSLGVEEQFYLLFPLFLSFVWRTVRRHLLKVVLFAFFASLLVAYIGSELNSDVSFFFTPGRAWELLAGSVVALVWDRGERRSTPVLGLLGVAILAASIFWLQKVITSFVLLSLLSVVGSSLILLYGQGGSGVSRVLSCRPLVLIGRASYSIYLWHYPIMVLWTQHFERGAIWEKVFLVVTSIALGFGSWKFVEIPTRFCPRERLGRLLGAGAVASLFLLFASVAVQTVSEDGLWRLVYPLRLATLGQDGAAAQKLIFEAEEEFRTRSVSDCLVDVASEGWAGSVWERCPRRNAILLLGDSHARDIYQALSVSASRWPSDLQVLGAFKGGCRLGEGRNSQCDDHYSRVKEFVSGVEVSNWTIVYVQALRNLEGSDGEVDSLEVERLLTVLESYEALGANVVWMGPRAEVGLTRAEVSRLCRSDTSAAVKQDLLKRSAGSVRGGVQNSRALGGLVSDLRSSVRYASQVELLGQESFSQSALTDCERLFWSDPSHLSRFGEEMHGEAVVAFFEELEADFTTEN